MVDALLVFSPLQEICFFVLRSPYFDRIGVAPLLRRRLFGLQSFSLLVFQVRLLASSFALLRVALSTLRQPSQPAGLPLRLCLSAPTQILPSLLRSVAPYLPFELLSLRFFNS